MPANVFLIRTSPSLGVGLGASVVYVRTSGPPVLSIIMALMFAGRIGPVERKRSCVVGMGRGLGGAA
jgi:hypothetical protein